MQTNCLEALAEEVRRSLALLGPDPEPWTPAIDGVDDTVTIVGAGQSGLAAAFALRRKGIRATIIEAESEGEEGVWRARARMPTLRTPKDRPGPELGIPALSFRAWYTAAFDEQAWRALGRARRETWADYLAWFRKTLGLEVSFGARLINVEPAGVNLRLTIERNGKATTRVTRKLVLAMGLTGGGAPDIPDIIAGALPRHLYAHTDDKIDFSKLRGKRIGVLGASASGFDAACSALEQGAETARLFCRAPDLARGARYRWADFPGADYFFLLPDEDRWRVASHYLARGNHPPATAIERACAVKGFSLHLGAPWDEVRMEGDVIHVRSGDTWFDFDFVIAATGFRHDPSLSASLQSLAPHIALWKNRYTPPLHERNSTLENYPYLGDAFQYLEREKGERSCVGNVHVLNTSAMLSFLRIVGDIKFLGFTSERLAAGIVRDLFLADRAMHIERLTSPVIQELTGAEYVGLIWRN